MALADILDAINKKLAQELKEIETDEAKSVQEIKESFGKKGQKTLEELKKHRDTKLKEMEKKMSTIENMESRNMMLNAKSELIESVFKEALGKLSKMNDVEYKKWIEKSFKELPKGKWKLITVKNRMEATKQVAKSADMDCSVIEGDMLGGYKAISETMEMDNTFETIIYKSLKPQIELEVAQTLFQ